MIRAYRHPARSAGFSLVELMVALVVGLLLLAGVLQILLGNSQTFDAQRGRARLQENARLVSFVLENSVAHAGFWTPPSPLPPSLPQYRQRIFKADSNGFGRGEVVGGSADTQGKNDTLRVRFQGEGGVHNCRGTEIGGVDNPVKTGFKLYVNNNTLYCRVFGGSVVPQPLVEDVDRFEVRYGLDTNAKVGVDRYVSDLSGLDPTEVRSVRIQLLLRSPKKVLPTVTERTFRFSDGTGKTYDDRLGRLMLDQTIAIRNALP